MEHEEQKPKHNNMLGGSVFARHDEFTVHSNTFGTLWRQVND